MSRVQTQSNPTEDLDAFVGRRVHQMMWDKKITQVKMGAALGVDQSAIAKKLRADQKFSLAQLSIVAAELGTSISYLIGEANEPTPTGPETTPTEDSGKSRNGNVRHVDFSAPRISRHVHSGASA